MFSPKSATLSGVATLLISSLACLTHAATIATIAPGDWSDGAIWAGGAVPGTGDVAQVLHAVSLSSSQAVGGVDLQATLTHTAQTLSVSGDFAIGAGGSYAASGTSTTVTMNGTGPQSLAAATYAALQINNSAATPDDTNAVTCTGPVETLLALTVADGQFMPATGSRFRNISVNAAGILKPVAAAEIEVFGNSAGSALLNSGTFTANGSRFTFTGLGGQFVTSFQTFHDLVINKPDPVPSSANAFLAGGLTVTNEFRVIDGRARTGTTLNQVIVEATGEWELLGGLSVAGDLNIAGTLIPGTNNLTMNGSGPQVITTNSPLAALTIANTAPVPSDTNAVSATGPIICSDDLFVSDGQFNLPNGSRFNSIFLAGDGILKPEVAAVIELRNAYGTNGFNNGGTFVANQSRFLLTSLLEQNITGNPQFYDLEINKATATPDSTNDVSGQVTVTNELRVRDGRATLRGTWRDVVVESDGELSLQGPTNVQGNFTCTGLLLPGTQTLTMAGTGPQVIDSNTAFYGLTINNTAATPSDTDAVTAIAPVITASTLTVNDGQFMPSTGSTFDTLQVNAAGILKPPVGAEITLAGSYFNQSGTFTANQSRFIVSSPNAQDLNGTVVFYDLVVNKPSVTPDSTNDVQNPVTVENELEVIDGRITTSGTFRHVNVRADGELVMANTSSVRGNFTCVGFFDPGTFTLNMTGTGPQVIDSNTAFHALTITNTAATPSDTDAVTAISPVVVNDQMLVQDGQFMPSNGSRFRNVVVMSSNAILKPAAGVTIEIFGNAGSSLNLSSGGVFTANGGRVVFTGTAGQSLGGGPVFHDLEVNQPTATPDSSNDLEGNSITVANDLIITDGRVTLIGCTIQNVLVQPAGELYVTGLINVTGDFRSTGTFVPGTAQVFFNGSGRQEIDSNTAFGNLTIANTAATPNDIDAVVATSATTTTLSLQVNDGQFMPADGSQFRDVYIGTNGILKPVAGAGIRVTGADGSGNALFRQGTFTANSSRFTFESASTQRVSASTTFHDLVVNNLAATPNSTNDFVGPNIFVLNDFEVRDGQAYVSGSAGNVIVQPNGILNLSFSFSVEGDFTSVGTFLPNTHVVTFNGTGPQVIDSNSPFHWLQISNSAATPDDANAVTAIAPVITANNLVVNDGQFMPSTGSRFRNIVINLDGILKPASGAVVEVSGNDGAGTALSRTGVFTANDSRFVFTGTTGQTVSTGTTFYDLEVNNTAATPDTTNDFAATLAVANEFRVVDGLATVNGSVGDAVVEADGILSLTSGLNVAGDFTCVGTFQVGTQVVTMNGTGPQVIDSNSPFYWLQINNSATTPDDANAVTAVGPVTTTHNLVVNDGQFMPSTGSRFRNIVINAAGILKPASGAVVEVNGNDGLGTALTRNGLLTANGSRFVFTGTTGQAVTAGTPFYDLEINNPVASPDTTNDFAANIAVANEFRVVDGLATVFGTARDVVVEPDGLLTLSFGLSVAGDFTCAGTFTPATFAVTMNGTGPQVIDSNSAFNILSINNSAATPDDANAVTTVGGVTTTGGLNVTDGQFMPSTGSRFRSIFISANGILKPASGAVVEVYGADGGGFAVNRAGTLTPNNSRFVFTGTTGQSVTFGTTFYDVEVNNPVASPDTTNDFSTNLTVINEFRVVDGLATVQGSVGDVVVEPDGLLTLSFPLSVAGDFTSLGTFSPATFAVTMNGNGPQVIDSNAAFNTLTINNSAATPDDANAVTTVGAVTTLGVLNVTDGQFMPSTGSRFRNISIAATGILKPASGAVVEVYGNDGASTALSRSGLLTPNDSRFVFTGTTGQNVTFGTTFYDLEVNKAAAVPDSTNDFEANITVANEFRVVDGLATVFGSAGDVVVEADGLLTLSFPLSVAGDFTCAGTFSPATFAVTMNGAGPQVIDSNSAFDTLTINNSAATPDDANAVTTVGAVTTLGVLNVTDGQFMPSTASRFRNISIAATGILKPASGAVVEVYGNDGGSTALSRVGLLTPNDSRFVFSGTAGQTITSGTTFYDLEVNNTAATPDTTNDFEANLTVANEFRVVDGLATVQGSVGDVVVGPDGLLALSFGLNVAGDFTNTGSFSPGTFAVTMNGSGPQVIDSNAAFAGLTINNSAATPDDANAVTALAPVITSLGLTVTDGQFMPPSGSLFRNITLNTNGILKPEAGAVIVVSGNDGGSTAFQRVGSGFDPNGSQFIFTGITGQFVTSGTTFHDLEIDNAAATPDTSNDFEASALVVQGALAVRDGRATLAGSVAGNLDVLAAGELVLTSGLSVAGDWSCAGVFTPGANAVTMNGAGRQEIDTNSPFGRLIIANTAPAPSDIIAVDPLAPITVTAALEVNDGQLNAPTGSSFNSITILADGILTPAVGATIEVTGAASGVGFSSAGTFNANGGTVRFTGVDGQSVSSTTAFHNLHVSTTNGFPSAANDLVATGITVDNELRILDGLATLTAATVGDLVVETDGLLAAGGLITVRGDWTCTGGFDPAGQTVRFAGTGPQNINTTGPFHQLEILNTAAAPSDTDAVIATAAVSAPGGLLVNDGQFGPLTGSQFGYITIAADGIFKPAAGAVVEVTDKDSSNQAMTVAGTFTANGGRMVFLGIAGQAVTGSPVFHDLEINNTVALPTTSNHFSASAIQVGNLFRIIDGLATVDGSFRHVQIDADGLLTAADSLNVLGDWTCTGVFDADGQTVAMRGTGAQLITTNSDFHHLAIANTAATPDNLNAVSAAAAFTTTGELAVLDGRFIPASGSQFNSISIAADGILAPPAVATITVAGADGGGASFSNAGGSFLANAGTVIFSSAAAQGIVGNPTFHDLEISNSAATPDTSNDVAGQVTVGNELRVIDGLATLHGSFKDVEVYPAGILGAGGAITVSGNWMNNGGFEPATQTVVFNGAAAQSITQAAAFNSVAVANSGGTADASAVSTTGAITTNAGLSVIAGQFAPATGSTFHHVSLGGSGLLKPASGAAITISGADGSNVALARSAGGAFNPNAGRVVFAGAARQTVAFGLVFHDLEVLNTAATPDATNGFQGDALIVQNNLLVADGFALFNGGTFLNVAVLADGVISLPTPVSVAGNWAVASLPPTPPSVVFNGNGPQTIDTVGAFGDVTIANGAATPSLAAAVTSAAPLNVQGELIVQDGQFSPAATTTFGGAVTVLADGLLEVQGDHTIAGNMTFLGSYTPPADLTLAGTGARTLEASTPVAFNTLRIPAGVTLDEIGPADSTAFTLVLGGTVRRITTVSGSTTGGLTEARLDIAAPGTLGAITVTRVGSVPNPSVETTDANSWTFDVGAASGYNVTLTLPNPFAAAAATVARYSGSGNVWTLGQTAVTATTVSRAGITDLSSTWAVADTTTQVRDWRRMMD